MAYLAVIVVIQETSRKYAIQARTSVVRGVVVEFVFVLSSSVDIVYGLAGLYWIQPTMVRYSRDFALKCGIWRFAVLKTDPSRRDAGRETTSLR